MNLTIPTRNDPIARFAVFALMALALWASFAPARPEVQAQDIIIMATPTPALPTPALAMPGTGDWGLGTGGLPTPEWPTTSQEPFPGTEGNQGGDYIANVGAQAPHSPRGDIDHPQSYDTGPILYPDQGIIIDPLPQAEPLIAIAVPPISDAQIAVIGLRQSDGCAAGELFYPRTGCHLPGSGGALPGAVGEK